MTAIAEIAETYMDVVGVDEFKTMQVRMLYNCVSEDKWKEQMKPVEEGKPLVFEQNA